MHDRSASLVHGGTRAGAGCLVRRVGHHDIVEVIPQRGGGSSGLQGFKITGKIVGGAPKVRITVSLIAGAIPDGFTADDSTPFLLDVADGNDIYLTVAWDATGETPGAVLTRTAHAGEVPADDKPNATFSYRIGHVTVTGTAVKVTQYRYGPISSEVVRDWAKTPKEFSASNQ